MLFWIIPLIIGIILLLVFLVFRVKEKRVIAVIIKSVVSLMFIITAIVAWKTSTNPNHPFGICVLVGLILGLFGDVFLDLKYIVLKHELLFTILGFIAFALGHTAYISGLFTFFYNYNETYLYLIVPIIIATALTVFTVLMEKFTPIRYNQMKPFVAVYGFVLFFVTSIYFSVALQGNWSVTPINIMAISFILFALSDLILNNTYFSKGFTAPVYIVTNHLLYYAAQFAIAVALFYLI